MSKQEFIEALAQVVGYMWHDEEKSYEECSPAERKQGSGHIFHSLQVLRKYVEAQGKKIYDPYAND